jgi:hypothetical protein
MYNIDVKFSLKGLTEDARNSLVSRAYGQS